MRSSILLSGASLLAYATASSFRLDPVTTHQPNGNPDGQVNYYHITFNVTSPMDDSVACCTATWGDNSWQESEAYSMNVPTGDWISCAAVEKSAQVAFQLYPYFSIGNFSLSIEQNYTDDSGILQTATSTVAQITNTTATDSSPSYSCSINPEEVKYEQHAQGDCVLPANSSGIEVDIAKTSRTVTCSDPINATFVASWPTTWGQTVQLTGSIPELGNWDLNKAVSMVGAMPNPSPAWTVFTTYVEIDPGTDFEYKFVFVNTTGVKTWENGDNRSGSTSAYSCGSTIIGGHPDDVRLATS